MINGNHDLILWRLRGFSSGEREDRLSCDKKLRSLEYIDTYRLFGNVRNVGTSFF
jgi:hypothetical protein